MKLDLSDPGLIMAFLVAMITDVGFLFSIAFLIPGVGIVIMGAIVLFHYFAGAMLIFLVLIRLNHMIPKVLLGAAILFPLPLLTAGLIIAFILQSKFAETVAIQGAAVVLGAVSGGAGAVAVEGAAAGGTAAEVGGAAAQAARAAGAATKGVQATAQETEGWREAAQKGLKRVKDYADRETDEENENRPDVDPRALGEEAPLLGEGGELMEDLLENPSLNGDNGERRSNVLPFQKERGEVLLEGNQIYLEKKEPEGRNNILQFPKRGDQAPTEKREPEEWEKRKAG